MSGRRQGLRKSARKGTGSSTENVAAYDSTFDSEAELCPAQNPGIEQMLHHATSENEQDKCLDTDNEREVSNSQKHAVETAENVAADFGISRADQDAFAHRSQGRAAKAQAAGRFAREITPISLPQRRGDPIIFDTDEHPRTTSLEKLASLTTPFRQNGTVTAGNASGVNDGAAALIIASQAAVERFDLKPMARILGTAVAGVAPRIMGIGPAPASEKLLQRLGLTLSDIDLIELNEAFAAQGLAVMRQLGLADDAAHVNPNGGAIALGHPLGMSGARLALTAAHEMQLNGHKRALCTMCIGVGQGIAMILEKL